MGGSWDISNIDHEPGKWLAEGNTEEVSHKSNSNCHEGETQLLWVCLCFYPHVHAQSLQSCPTLCDPINSSPPGSSVHGIFPAGILKWVANSYSRGSSPPGIQATSTVSSALQADTLCTLNKYFTCFTTFHVHGSFFPAKLKGQGPCHWPLAKWLGSEALTTSTWP